MTRATKIAVEAARRIAAERMSASSQPAAGELLETVSPDLPKPELDDDLDLRRVREFSVRDVVRMAFYAGRGWTASPIAEKIGTTAKRVRMALGRHGVEPAVAKSKGALILVIEDRTARDIDDLSYRFGVRPEVIAATVLDALDAKELEMLTRRRE